MQRAGRGAQVFQRATVGRLQLSGAGCGATPDAVSRRRSHLWPNRGKLSQGTERSSTGDVRRWHRSLDGAEATVDGDTLATIESSWVRPRFPGYIPFQSSASDILRAGLSANPDNTLDDLDAAYAAARNHRKAPV